MLDLACSSYGWAPDVALHATPLAIVILMLRQRRAAIGQDAGPSMAMQEMIEDNSDELKAFLTQAASNG